MDHIVNFQYIEKQPPCFFAGARSVYVFLKYSMNSKYQNLLGNWFNSAFCFMYAIIRNSKKIIYVRGKWLVYGTYLNIPESIKGIMYRWKKYTKMFSVVSARHIWYIYGVFYFCVCLKILIIKSFLKSSLCLFVFRLLDLLIPGKGVLKFPNMFYCFSNTIYLMCFESIWLGT